MQETLFNPIQFIRKQATSKYWAGFIVNGAANLFLDEDQLNLVKVVLSLVFPIVIVYAKVKVSEMSTFLLTVANAVTNSPLCNQVCRT